MVSQKMEFDERDAHLSGAIEVESRKSSESESAPRAGGLAASGSPGVEIAVKEFNKACACDQGDRSVLMQRQAVGDPEASLRKIVDEMSGAPDGVVLR